MGKGHPGRVTPKALEYLKEVVDYGFGNSIGPNMGNRFEEAFAKRFGVRYAIAQCNGTATMHSCLAAAGVKPGDEVIVPPLTAAATAFCCMHQGAIPVFADLDAKTLNIDPESIKKRITPLTRAIIPVGLYGLPADMDPIMEIARKHNLTVIEDNAQCFLGEYKGRLAGTIGHMSSFSLQASKHLTCGDGGVVITDDQKLANGVRRFGVLGFRIAASEGVMSKETRGHPTSLRHDFLGWNYRMSDLQAAVALEQTERIDELVGLRKKIGAMYLEAVKDCPWFIPQYTPPGYIHSYWTFVCRFEAKEAGCTWDDFRNTFHSLGGDFLYGAWQLTYNEPVFQERRFLGGFFPIDSEIYKGKRQEYKPGLCPTAESLQPKLMQFKTNYYNLAEAEEQAEVLRKTIEVINERKRKEGNPLC
ncbi:MAG: DegT/DnrJ/EryC1/StrS family aminotransferase [Candidatus Omnitrophota bacterium]